MKKKEKQQLREKTIKELQIELKQIKDELALLLFDHKRGKLKNTSSILHKRKTLAVIQTILQEKLLNK